MNTECDENEELMLFRLGSKWLIIEQIWNVIILCDAYRTEN